VGQHHRPGVAGRAAGGDDQGIAIGHGLLGASSGQDALAGGTWQAGVDRHDGVAFIPGASQPVDELAGAPRLDHDQPAHGGGGYGRRRRSTVDGIDAPYTTSEATIRTQALTKVYDAVAGGPADTSYLTPPAVDALDLEVGRGELFGLLGPNGAGKTTTIGMLTTRVVPSGGRAFVDGIDVVAEPALAKERIGVVTQANTLDRSLDVRENLEFHARYFGMVGREARAAADRMLEVMRLTEKASADVGTLSGGMAQRLMVARAILHRPEVLFLDEPTAGLDPQSRLGLWDIVRELHRDGQTVLLTTHYMEEADQLCERVAIMDHGRILALDQPARLKRSLGVDTVVTVQAEGDGGDLADALRGLQGATGAQVVDGAVRLYVDGGDGVLPRVITAAERAGHAVRDLRIEEPTLETVFINLTGRELRE
jgi:ABC-2 type transport system ATP-binding protein